MSSPAEEWRPVVGYEGAYEVSSLGRVRSLDRHITNSLGVTKFLRGRVLRPGPRPSGHLTVGLPDGSANVHTLVLTTFVCPRPTPEHQGRHLNGNERDNRLANLAWSTRTRNMQDRKYHKGAGHYVLTPIAAREIKIELAKPPRRGKLSELARKYGVSKSTIGAIQEGRFHVDITP